MNPSRIVVLGSAGGLALAELSSLIPETFITKLFGPCVCIKDSLSPKELLDCAGGVVKIATFVKAVQDIYPRDLAEILLSIHKDKPAITFGISRYDGERVKISLLAEIKKVLEQQGKRVRFIASKTNELTSVVIKKQDISELVIAQGNEEKLVGHTIAVQDFESWGKRDFGRPHANPKLGMLPPKVARMAVNIAIGFHGEGKTVADPFCGMGTVLAEGLMRGCRVVGSDVSEDVITKAGKNLEWLTSQYPPLRSDAYRLFAADATHISDHVSQNSIDAIVTEPFMGTPNLGEKRVTDPEQIRGIVKGLEKLYIGCLRDWRWVLKSGGKVVIALPKIEISRKKYFVKKVVDNCENLGYSKQKGPIEYSRPQAVVKREFFVFMKR